MATVAVLGIMLAGAGPLAAQEKLETISVTGSHKALAFKLDRIRRDFARFNDLPESERDKVRLSFYLAGKQVPDTSALELAIVSDLETLPVSVTAHGRVDIPQAVMDMKGDAVLQSNTAGAPFNIIYKIDVVPESPGLMKVSYLRSAITQARSAWKKEYGAGSLLVPRFNCASFQFSSIQPVNIEDENHSVVWSASGTDVKVPLSSQALPDDAKLLWDDGQLVRIAACKE
ncbi:hypothetical protein [Dyella sp. C11]|uniref:hypothetical protein n=1 Tax=Dyella sp. C11 TaxID=2126991 RepID=UPI001300A705|nr:hypothetical protein [Dyella sp. C11]